MAYTAWSVVYGEQPTAAKWNQLGTNDAGFKDGTNIDSGVITPAKLSSEAKWWEELGRHTLGSTSATMTVSFTAKKYLQIILAGTGTSTGLFQLRFNNDSAANYARRTSTDGAVDATAVSGGVLVNHTAPAAGSPALAILDVINIANLQKLAMSRFISDVTTGAATAPSRNETATKWVNTSVQISRVDALLSTGSFTSGSELIILGHD